MPRTRLRPLAEEYDSRSIGGRADFLGGYPVSKLIAFFKDESGASAAEYALILAIVGVGIVTAATALKDAIATAMNNASTTISSS